MEEEKSKVVRQNTKQIPWIPNKQYLYVGYHIEVGYKVGFKSNKNHKQY